MIESMPDTGITTDRARRDLRWLLQHTPIVRDLSNDGIAWIGSACIDSIRRTSTDSIDTISDALLEPARKQRRSGRYFEALVVALIKADQDLELLAHDLQVQGAERTLGAFDLLVRNRQTQAVAHLELAFKQYLYRGGESTAAEHWLGPRGRDRLDLKTRHMQNHQLKLGGTSPGRAALASMGIEHVERRALMAGRLFINRHAFQAKRLPTFPEVCSQAPELGWWCGEGELDALSACDSDWRVLPPPYSVAPLNADDCGALPAPDWTKIRQGLAKGHPCLIAECGDGAEVSRGWIVGRQAQAITAAGFRQSV